VFVLPCVEARSGDMDGIPLVLIEAMALGVPVVSTDISGIPELVRPGENGLLVRPGDAAALAGALEGLMADPDRATRLAAAGRITVETEFELGRNVDILKGLFTETVTQRQGP